MKLEEKKLEQSIFKTKVFENKTVDDLIKDAFDSVNRDDLKVGGLIDELMSIIQSSLIDEDERIAQISFLAPVLAELYKSSADFKKQKTDLLNSIQKYIATEYKKKTDDEGVGSGNWLAEAYKDISNRRED